MGILCILLFMKLIWHSGFPEIYAQLEEKVGSYDDLGILHSTIYETVLV